MALLRKAFVFNLQPRQTFTNLDMEDLDPSLPDSIASLENTPVPRPAKRKMPKKKKKNVQVEETSESEFREVATKYMQKLTCGPAEKEKTADYHFCDTITKSLNAMIDGEQKELLKLEIHQLVVKAQYGTSSYPHPWESFTTHI